MFDDAKLEDKWKNAAGYLQWNGTYGTYPAYPRAVQTFAQHTTIFFFNQYSRKT